MEIVLPAWAVSIIAVLIGILGAFAVQRFIAFRKASIKFRSTVLGILSGLYPIPAHWPDSGNAVDQALHAAFPALQTAVTEFRDSLPICRRREFDQAWFIYRLGSEGRKIDKQCYDQYMGFSSPDKVIPDSKVTFHVNVSRLLSFSRKL